MLLVLYSGAFLSIIAGIRLAASELGATDGDVTLATTYIVGGLFAAAVLLAFARVIYLLQEIAERMEGAGPKRK